MSKFTLDASSPSLELIKTLKLKAQWVRKSVLEMAVRSNSGHITTAFSQTELLVALYYGRILSVRPEDPKWSLRDRFILSKGQGGLGLYPILADCGFFSRTELEIFAQKESILGVHADWNIPGIEIISGALGHGLPIATGMAQVGKIDRHPWLVYCLLGDAELYEGSNWEAALFASHQNLGNLICIVDRNQQGVLGFTDEIDGPRDGPRLDSIEKKFEAFGFETLTINGHSFPEIFQALANTRARVTEAKKPLVIVAHTVKGKGAATLENKRLWHYRVPKGEDLENVRRELSEGLVDG